MSGTLAFAIAMSLAARHGCGVAGMLAASYACWLLTFLATGLLKAKVLIMTALTIE